MDDKRIQKIIEKAARGQWTELDLSDKGLTTVPESIAKLSNLTYLVLSDNQLTSLPEYISKLSNLTFLNLSGNQLTSMPESFVKLSNLTIIDLSNNQLTALPEPFAKLSNLILLDLSGNKLTSLPESIAKLSKFISLGLEGNPLKSPPPAVVSRGTKAVLEYLRELEKKSRKRYEAKMLLLGDGGEGKTCVSRALRGLKFRPQITTRGVDVIPWTFAHPEHPEDKDKQITLNIWDFEGQEIHHQTHQFFMSEESLYILVFKCREIFLMNRAEYWLDTIRARAPKSRVIVVMTECEERTPFIPLDKLKNMYKDLLEDDEWFFAEDCETGKGKTELRNRIQRIASDMKLMDLSWPASCTKAEETIEQKASDKGENIAHITRRELIAVFKKAGISESSSQGVAEYMGSLGIITHFPDCPDLKDFVVLKPQWLTKAISLVLEDSQVQQDQGEITHERLHSLWDKNYPGLANVFHICMKEFELCYDMEHKTGCLLPLRFGSLKPEIPWTRTQGAKQRHIEYKFNIRPPLGIMSRFIVKTHHLIAKTSEMPKGVYWNNGVFLRTGDGPCRSEALCEFDTDNRTLSITVQAAFPQNMTESLHGFAQSVFSFFQGLVPERYYGCIKVEDHDTETPCTGKHEEYKIFYHLSKEKLIGCEKGWHDIDPRQLVYGFSSFGNYITTEKLRRELDRAPKWAEGIISNMPSFVSKADQLSAQVNVIRQKGEQVPAEIQQKLEMCLREHLIMIDQMLDDRDFNSAPALVTISPTDSSKWNPTNWFTKSYILIPYCEFRGDIHPIKGVCEPFKMSREWWEKTGPKLGLGIKLLSTGVQIACAGLPFTVDTKLFESIKNEADFMKELSSHLEKIDTQAEQKETQKILNQESILDLRQTHGEDPFRIARWQISELLKKIAPENYNNRKWGPLRPVRMPDSTYYWMCDKHAHTLGR